ncbi:hypothetical protein PV326_006632 [Microctonus aethiopoides]|nr:hypothetical protein PV326_006632 [Microctonus aethiopoides]
MADGDNGKVANETNVEKESLNDRRSFSGNSGNYGSASTCKFQPVRVKALLHMYESDDDDSEDKDSTEDDEGALSEPDDERPPLPLDDEDSKSKNEVKQSDIKSSSDAFMSDVNTKNSNVEIITEEPERKSISRDSIKNVLDHYSSSISSGNNFANVITTMITSTSTTMSTTAVSNFNHHVYDKPQHVPTQSQDTIRSSSSRELFHDGNERKLSISKPSVASYISDFSAMDLDSKTGQSLLSRSKTFDSIGRKSEGNIFPSSVYGSRMQSNMKLETPDLVQPSHDRHLHSLTSYKSESVATSSSKHEVPVSISQSDKLPLSTNYLSKETPHKHNPPPGSMRPTPSVSHRNIFQTPQNKTQGDFSLNQGHAPTPGTIFSHWSQMNMMHTPMQHKISDSSQSSGKTILAQHDVANWYGNKANKSVRRPLAETTGTEHRMKNEKSSHGLKIPDPGENPSRQPLERIQEKVTMLPAITHDSKENRRPLILESSTKKDDFLLRNMMPEVVKPVQENRTNPPNQEIIPKSVPPNSEPLREHYNNNPPAVQNRMNIQASVPSSVRKTEYGKTMKVKNKEYMILGYLGKGMSGEVVQVQDLTNSELRAIKCVDLSHMDKDSAQSCIQEITMLGKLQAPCVIRMFDYEIRNKMIYVVMEMGDTDLSKFLKSVSAEKRLPLTMILYYWTEMLTAVKHIHDNGVIHSDLKPANFLLVRGRLKLIDFGIASSLNGDMTSIVKNSTVGTLNYISPESLMDVGESSNHNSKYKISYKSDVWSLGCILYSLVFGYTPFQHIRQQWPKINAICNPASKISFTQPPNSEPIPLILIDVMRKCLQHDPKARPSVAQLLEISYVPITKQNNVLPKISPHIILKIKNALTDEEWREYTEMMDQERKYC